MKTETNYICEICGNKFDSERRALECEENHAEVDSVKSVNYCGERYPYYLDVKMKNGEIKRYVMDD